MRNTSGNVDKVNFESNDLDIDRVADVFVDRNGSAMVTFPIVVDPGKRQTNLRRANFNFASRDYHFLLTECRAEL